jgi:hypothetical protein
MLALLLSLQMKILSLLWQMYSWHPLPLHLVVVVPLTQLGSWAYRIVQGLIEAVDTDNDLDEPPEPCADVLSILLGTYLISHSHIGLKLMSWLCEGCRMSWSCMNFLTLMPMVTLLRMRQMTH